MKEWAKTEGEPEQVTSIQGKKSCAFALRLGDILPYGSMLAQDFLDWTSVAGIPVAYKKILCE